MEIFKRGTGILPVENVRSPMKRRKESRARCPCHPISQVHFITVRWVSCLKPAKGLWHRRRDTQEKRRLFARQEQDPNDDLDSTDAAFPMPNAAP